MSLFQLLRSATAERSMHGRIGRWRQQISLAVDMLAAGALGEGLLYDDLRAELVNAQPGQVFFASGRSAVGDGGRGTFTCVTGGSYKDDDGSVLVATGPGTTQSRALFRDYDGDLNVQWYGADPTGVSDSTAAWAATQAAAIAAKKASWVPGGTYRVNDLALATDATWKLDPRATVNATDNTHDIFQTTSNISRVHIEGGTFGRCQYVVHSSSTGTINASTFRKMYVIGYTNSEPCLAAIRIPRGAGNVIELNNLDGGGHPGASKIRDGIVLGENSGDGAPQFFNASHVRKNRFVNLENNGVILADTQTAKNQVSITNNWFEQIGESGVNAGGGCRSVTVKNNYFAITGVLDPTKAAVRAYRTLGPPISGFQCEENFFGITTSTRLFHARNGQVSFNRNTCLIYHAGELAAEFNDSTHYRCEDNYVGYQAGLSGAYLDLFYENGNDVSGSIRIPAGNYNVTGNDSDSREVATQGFLLERRTSAPTLADGQGSIWRNANSGSEDDLMYTFRSGSDLYQTTLVDASLVPVYVFSPVDLGALRGYWRNVDSEITRSGTDVIAWRDVSGYGNDAGSDGNAPQYVANDGAGHIAVSFTAIDTQSLLANSAAFYFQGSDGTGLEDQPFFMFVAVQLTDILGTYTFLDFGASLDVQPERLMRSSGANFQVRLRDDAGTPKNPNGATADAALHYLIFNCNGTTVDIWLDGAKVVAAGDLDVGVIGAAALIDRCILGARVSTADSRVEYMNGNILQAGFGIDVLSGADVANLNAYLATVVA